MDDARYSVEELADGRLQLRWLSPIPTAWIAEGSKAGITPRKLRALHQLPAGLQYSYAAT